MINSLKASLNDQIISRLQQIYDGQPWYGKSIKNILSQHPGALPKRALDILNHMIAWRNFVSAELSDEAYQIEINSDMDWPDVAETSTDLLDKLDVSQVKLVASIRNFDASKWDHKFPEQKNTFRQLAEGVIDHDLYHLGQIALIYKRENHAS